MAAPRMISMSEVRQHKSQESLWLVISNSVYDVTAFLNEHPGGENTLLESAGIDATQAFNDVGHSADARELMKKFKIGDLIVEKQCKCDCKKYLPHLAAVVLAGIAVGFIIKRLSH